MRLDVLDEGTYTGPTTTGGRANRTDRERILVLDSIPPDFPQCGCDFVWRWAPKFRQASNSMSSSAPD